MEEKTIYTLLLGSNLGDRNRYLSYARELLESKGGRLLGASEVRESEAWGMEDQPDFLNQIVLLESELSPQDLLRLIHEIEAAMDRQRVSKWGPRTLDIDILFAEDRIIKEENLEIPHPRIAERNFTLVLLNDLAPDFVHPVLGKTAPEMLSDLGSTNNG